MIVPDANLLLNAYNSDSPDHQKASRWWEECLSGKELIGMVYPVLVAFMRIGIRTRAFSNPFTLSEAYEHVHDWLARSIPQILVPGQNHFDEVCKLLEGAGLTGGDLVTDAQIAAIAMAHKATVHTADRDFMRFRGLACHFPLDEAVRK